MATTLDTWTRSHRRVARDRRGGTLSGRIVTDTGVPVPQPEQRMRVTARAVDPTRTFSPFNQDNGRVKDDWTFEVKDVLGLNRVSASPMPRGWVVKSIEYDGKDLMDTPIEIASGQHVDGITVVLSKSLPKLTGSMLDDRGQPVDATVLLFPVDPRNGRRSPRD